MPSTAGRKLLVPPTAPGTPLSARLAGSGWGVRVMVASLPGRARATVAGRADSMRLGGSVEVRTVRVETLNTALKLQHEEARTA
jgi:hypothetical protein